jgi:microsomal dipeptidase-like Zn-dependent dipeptidase
VSTTKIAKGARVIALITIANFSLLAQSGSMRGFADLHNHQFANMYAGGYVLAGKPYGAIQDALSEAQCRADHSNLHAFDILGGFLAGYGGAIWYNNDGFPKFSGWPRIWEVSHQKVHQDFLLRAVQGGLRLIVMMAVESPILCQAVKNGGGHTDGRDCNDENLVRNQILAAKDMQTYIDQQSGGDGLGWYRIVKTPAEARQVIQSGKLAVVLGVETSHLFNCRKEPCTWEDGFADLWNLGVRHFFPIHQDQNAFGGPSYFQHAIQNGPNQLFVQSYKFPTYPCGYSFGECDQLGLTSTGAAFVRKVMSMGGIIDVDHMSDRSFSDTLDLAELYSYPVVASHAGFNEIKSNDQDHEGQLTSVELKRIQNVGGMVAPIGNQGGITEVKTYPRSGRQTIPHICGQSTETFAQAYYYVLDHAPGMAVAIGTDVNGPIHQVGPRFGSNQCEGGQGTGARSMAKLPSSFLARGSNTMLNPLKTGDRTWDFNTDGLAHEGMLPDMLADLEVLQVSPSDLEPIFNSAEGYVKMWERAEAQAYSTMVPNAGFETQSWSSWNVYSPNAGFTAKIVHDLSRTGSSALAESNAGGIVFQDISGLTPGKMYVVSAWVSFSGDANAKGELSVHDTTGSNFSQVFQPVQPGWRPLSILYTANSTGKVRVHLVRDEGSGTVYWDDISVAEAPPNGSFESGSSGPWAPLPSSVPSRITSDSNTGSNALEIIASADGGALFQDVSGLIPGRAYVVSAWVKLTPGTTSGAELQLHDTLGNQLSRMPSSLNTGFWQPLLMSYIANETGRLRILLFKNAGTGSAIWDDVTISEGVSISGRISRADGSGLAGVNVKLTGTPTAETVTDASGMYSFRGLVPGRYYIVRPDTSVYPLAPCERTYTSLTKNETGANFVVTNLPILQISGLVVTGSGKPLPGVNMLLNGDCSGQVLTDSSGAFSFRGLTNGGSYGVTPTPTALYDQFTPTFLTYTKIAVNQAGAKFVAMPQLVTISGKIASQDYRGLPGVQVTLKGSRSAAATTDASGLYSFRDLPADGDYTITPALGGYTFNPPSTELASINGSASANFYAVLAGYRISGQVLSPDGTALGNVLLTLTGSGTNNQQDRMYSDQNGSFAFEMLVPNGTYLITPSKSGYLFNPSVFQAPSLSKDISGVAFSGSRWMLTGFVKVQGLPLTGAAVEIRRSLAATSIPLQTQVDANGQFRALLPDAGRYDVTISSPQANCGNAVSVNVQTTGVTSINVTCTAKK